MSQIKKNLVFNLTFIVVNVIIAIFYSPYLIKNLGIVAYGILPLALLINQYISILTTSLTGALTRFYSIALNEKNYQKASLYLKISLFVLVGIVIIAVPFSLFILNNLDVVFNIPTRHFDSAKTLFIFTFLSFFSALISSFFSIVLYTENRLDLMNKIAILRTASKVLLVVFLFETVSIDLKYVGIGGFITELIVLFYSCVLFKKYSPKWSKSVPIERAMLYPILAMTLWVIIHQIGDLA
ncbi:hypothetical protein EIM50_18080, partial [Pseudoxanthomonas sp. SGD-10]